jgi:hypothetical protein
MFSFSSNPGGDHMYLSYLIIRRQQPCYSTSFCLLFSVCSLPNLLLNPSYASKISTHVPTWICSHACLKIWVKSITNLLDSCWSPSCSKLCSNTLFNNFNKCLSAIIPNSITFLALLSFFFFSFSNFFYNYLVHDFFPYNVWIFSKSSNMWLN